MSEIETRWSAEFWKDEWDNRLGTSDGDRGHIVVKCAIERGGKEEWASRRIRGDEHHGWAVVEVYEDLFGRTLAVITDEVHPGQEFEEQLAIARHEWRLNVERIERELEEASR